MRSHLTTNGAAGGRLPHSLYFAQRSFWALMVAVHAGAFPAAWAAVLAPEAPVARFAPVFRMIGLGLAAIICGLKTMDVPWLRLKPGWRSAISTTLVIALLHVSVIERVESGEIAFTPAHLGVFLVAGAVAESQTMRRMLGDLIRALARCVPAPRAGACLAVLGPAWQRWFTPFAQLSRCGPRMVRAPPAR
jgi:hypothetical protein